MSVESTITKVMYEGNGLATEWPVPFKYNKPEHLHLLVTDASEGHEQVSSNFQVQVTEAGDTSILYPVSGQPLPAGTRLTIYRATPQTQIVDLMYGGAFSPEVLEEDGLDREVMMIQEQQEAIDRAVKVGIDSDESPEELLQNIFDARDTAVTSAASAEGCANAAAESASAAAGSAASATEQRAAACLCAERAEAAADAAEESATLAKTTEIPPATATLRGGVRPGRGMKLVAGPDGVADVIQPVAGLAISETEGAVAAKAVTLAGFAPHAGARLCLMLAEANTAEAPALAVNPEEGGEALPILWAGAAPAPGELAAGLPWLLVCDGAAWHVTGARPDGRTIAARPDGSLTALGSALLYNRRLVIKESGDVAAPVTGWHRITAIGGGGGGGHGGGPYDKGGAGGDAGGATSVQLPDGTLLTVEGGGGGAGGGANGSNAVNYQGGGGGGGGVGECKSWYVYLRAGETITLTIGAGGVGATGMAPSRASLSGGGTRGGAGQNCSWVGGHPGLGGHAGGTGVGSGSTAGNAGPGGDGAMGPLGDAIGAGGGGGGGLGTWDGAPGGKSLAGAGQAGTKTTSGAGGDGGNGGVIIEYHDPALAA